MIRRAVALAAGGLLLAGTAAGPAAATSLVTVPAVLGLPVNVLPVPLPDAYSGVHDRKLRVDAPGVLANDIDADGDHLEADIVKGPNHGEVNLNHDGSFVYEPDEGYTGLDGFTYAANDGHVKVNALVALTVTNVAPVGHNDSYSTKEGVKLSVDRPGVLKNDDDADGEELTAKLVNGPDHGTLDLHDRGDFDYDPDNGFAGADVFTYRAQDGADQSAVVRVTIDVNPKPTPPPTASPPPTPAPTPTPHPTPTPDPTPNPTPGHTPKPDPTPKPHPTPTPTPDDGRGGSHGPGDSGGQAGTGGGKDPGAGGGDGGSQVGSTMPPEIAASDEFGLARSTTDAATGTSIAFDAGMAAAFDGFAWQVPALALSVPGVIVVIAVFLQVLGGLAWLPLIRRRLGGNGVDGLTPPDRRP